MTHLSHQLLSLKSRLKHPNRLKHPEKKSLNTKRHLNLFRNLSQVSYYRGGWGSHGSCIWSDIREHVEDPSTLPFFQVVGHTMLDTGKIIKLENIACIDSQKVWNLEEIYQAPLTIEK